MGRFFQKRTEPAVRAEPFDPLSIRTALVALVVAAACFVGAWTDTWIRFPQIGTGILFLPYAVLTAALLLSPPRHWWIYLLAASMGNFIPHRLGGATTSFVVLAELANYTKALVAATGMLYFGDRPDRFDTLRGTVLFLVFAVAVGPAAGAFIGAAVVMAHDGTHTYSLVWQGWFLSNALTGLTLLPILLVSLQQRANRRRPQRPRAAEAIFLSIELLAVGAYVFVGPHANQGSPPARLYWPLPFLLWAAVRFGPRGTGTALLGVTALTIWGAIHGHGPFAMTSDTENLVQLQLFLIAVSLPMLLLSAIMSQQRRTESDLRDSREQLRCVVEDQTEMICRFLPDGTCTFVNGAYCRYFQLTAQELIGRRMPNLIPTNVSSTDPVATRETSELGPGGERRWQQWRDRALLDARGCISEYQSVGRDITERKQAEDEHRELEAQRQVEAALREADRRKDEFIAMLGHELRNPLAPIGMALELLRANPHFNPENDWARDVIARQVGHMNRLVDDLLDVSRITRGKLRLRSDTVELDTVVAQAVETTRPLMESRSHELRILLPEESPRVRGDAVRLVQIVANLLNNAAKYTDPGGHIQLSMSLHGAQVMLTVRDSGLGIPNELLTRIFDLFVQAPAMVDTPQGGLGIGLTLVKRLVELHGGEVEARSAGLRCGSEFIVRLPLLDEQPVRPSPTLTPVFTHQRERPLRVLAVDDNLDVAEGLVRLLRTWGHQVDTAHDGLAALERAERFAPDVVLLDLGLPKMSGLEVARQLRQTARLSKVLLVAMTGFGQEQDHTRSKEAGIDHHLVKPVDMEMLRSLLGAFATRDEPQIAPQGSKRSSAGSVR